MNHREQLLQAAVRVYSEVGYRGATTRRIASEAGVNEITLFRHFGSKDALLREAINRAEHAVVEPALPELPEAPFAEVLEWARRYITGLRERRALIRTCMGEIEEHPGLIPPEDSPPAKAAKHLCRYLVRLRELEYAKADFDELAASALLMGALFADSMGRDVIPDMYSNQPEEALREYVRLFLRGIGVEQSDSAGDP